MFAQKVEKLMLGLLGVVCPFFILNLVAQKGVAYKKKSQIATNFDPPPPCFSDIWNKFRLTYL